MLWDGHWSEQVAKCAVRVSAQVPFAEAEWLLQQLAGILISDSSLWRRLARWGEQFRALESRQRVEANAAPARGTPVVGEARDQPQMGLAMDGVMIPLRHEEERYRELKVACAFQIELRPTRDQPTGEMLDLAHAVDNSYVAHLGGPELFGQLAWSEARRRRWPRAQDTIVLCDGAPWLWNLVKEHFYDSHQAVDWYHATEHLAKVGRLVCGEGTPQARQWFRAREGRLLQGQAQSLAAEIRQLAKSKQGGRAAEDLGREAGYFETNHRRMQYLELREAGFPIGSGMVESAGKQYRARFCGSGMSWSRGGAERMIPVRSALMSRRFDELWQAAYSLPQN